MKRLTADEIKTLRSEGAKLNTANGTPYVAVAPKPDEDVRLLRMISTTLDQILRRPQPEQHQVTVPAPEVVVKAPEVIVKTSEPITKWKFELKKDSDGRTTEIIATAIK